MTQKNGTEGNIPANSPTKESPSPDQKGKSADKNGKQDSQVETDQQIQNQP